MFYFSSLTVLISYSQPFWGAMVASAGAGPKPIPHKTLTSSNLSEAVKFCLSKEATHAAKEISARMRNELGIKSAVESFHRNLPVEALACDLLPAKPATWILKTSKGMLKISNIAAEALIEEQLVQPKSLKMYVHL